MIISLDVGLNSSGSYSTSDAESALRSGVQWLRFTAGSGLTLTNNGRIYDSATSSPYFYFYPSLSVNVNNDMVIGFSCSKTNEWIGALYSGRRGSDGVRPT